MHKRALIMLLVLVIVAGTSFALEVGGSTTTGISGNKDEQIIIVEQEIDFDLGAFHVDVDGEVEYDLPVKEHTWEYEIGASYAFSIFKVGGAFGGNKDLKLEEYSLFADIVYETVGADIDFLFSADETKDVFQGAEFSVFFDVGSMACRVGYMMKSGEVDANTPAALDEGGFYAEGTITY